MLRNSRWQRRHEARRGIVAVANWSMRICPRCESFLLFCGRFHSSTFQCSEKKYGKQPCTDALARSDHVSQSSNSARNSLENMCNESRHCMHQGSYWGTTQEESCCLRVACAGGCTRATRIEWKSYLHKFAIVCKFSLRARRFRGFGFYYCKVSTCCAAQLARSVSARRQISRLSLLRYFAPARFLHPLARQSRQRSQQGARCAPSPARLLANTGPQFLRAHLHARRALHARKEPGADS